MIPNSPYDSIADWYASRAQEGGPGAWAFPAFFNLIGDVENQHICDIGCGEGRATRLLAQQGGQMTGIDISAELIKAAQRQESESPLGISYQVGDAQSLEPIADVTFDGVTSCLSLMDIPDLAATLQSVGRILKPNGWFTFLITHPCFATPHAGSRQNPDGSVTWEISRYFEEGFWRDDNAGTLIANVGAHHRKLSTYLNGLVSVGLHITDIIEPNRLASDGEMNPGHNVVPLLMVVRSVKAIK